MCKCLICDWNNVWLFSSSVHRVVDEPWRLPCTMLSISFCLERLTAASPGFAQCLPLLHPAISFWDGLFPSALEPSLSILTSMPSAQRQCPKYASFSLPTVPSRGGGSPTISRTFLFVFFITQGFPQHSLPCPHFNCLKPTAISLGQGPAFSTIHNDWVHHRPGHVDLCFHCDTTVFSYVQ